MFSSRSVRVVVYVMHLTDVDLRGPINPVPVNPVAMFIYGSDLACTHLGWQGVAQAGKSGCE
jgi:hypothetical protein